MKNLTLFLLIMISITSCKSYMISTVSSNNTNKESSSGAHFIENDTVKITYSFNGENSPLTLEVFNKLNEPVYVNWEQSAVVLNNKVYSFVDDKLAIHGTTSSARQPYNFQTGTDNLSNFSGMVKLPQNGAFLPPRSQVSRTIYALNTINTFQLDQTDYTASTSPIQFRCYVTLYTMSDGRPKPFSFEQSFWVSSIVKNSGNPFMKKTDQYQPANRLVNSNSAGNLPNLTGPAIFGVAAFVAFLIFM